MEIFAKRLRERAKQLALSDAEVARRVGLAERRYGHYVRGSREPDFATLLRICSALGVTPNDLLGPAEPRRLAGKERWIARVLTAAQLLSPEDVKLAARQVEVLLDCRRSQLRKA